jgi:hypothetical protein
VASVLTTAHRSSAPLTRRRRDGLPRVTAPRAGRPGNGYTFPMSETTARMEAERSRLDGYIQNSRRVQRKLTIALPIGVAVAIAVWVLDGRVGFALLAATLGVVGIGFWITAGHIAEWNTRLEVLARQDAPPGAPRSRYAP